MDRKFSKNSLKYAPHLREISLFDLIKSRYPFCAEVAGIVHFKAVFGTIGADEYGAHAVVEDEIEATFDTDTPTLKRRFELKG